MCFVIAAPNISRSMIPPFAWIDPTEAACIDSPLLFWTYFCAVLFSAGPAVLHFECIGLVRLGIVVLRCVGLSTVLFWT